MTDPGWFTAARLRSVLPSLAPAEQRVGRRVLDDPSGVAGSTISALAAACGTSEATVVRFCRAVGLSGYPELRMSLAAEAGRAERLAPRDVSGDIRPGDDLESVVAKIAHADARAVEETAQMLDLVALRHVVDAVVGARRIDVVGVGASAIVAADLQQKLHRIGLTAFAWGDPHVAVTSVALLDSRDVAIGISHSGSTPDTRAVMAQAADNGVRTVAITQYPRSPLGMLVDHTLTTAARETTFRSGATASRLAQLTVVDCLFVAAAQRTYEASQQALEVTHRAVQERLR